MLLKQYKKELTILAIQLLMFYLYPLYAIRAAGPMGMVFLLLASTMLLSAVLAVISNHAVRFLYPVVAAVVFIPSVWIYYNESALVHSLWYFVTSLVGIGLGTVVRIVLKSH